MTRIIYDCVFIFIEWWSKKNVLMVKQELTAGSSGLKLHYNFDSVFG